MLRRERRLTHDEPWARQRHHLVHGQDVHRCPLKLQHDRFVVDEAGRGLDLVLGQPTACPKSGYSVMVSWWSGRKTAAPGA